MHGDVGLTCGNGWRYGVRMSGFGRALFRCEYFDERWAEQCADEQLPTSKFCVLHAPADEMDLSRHQAKVLRASRYRGLSKAPRMMDELIHVAEDREGEPGATRVRAAEAVLDRVGLPRMTAAQVDITGGIEVSVTDVRASFEAAMARLTTRTHEIIDALPDEDDSTPPPPPTPPTAAVAPTPG